MLALVLALAVFLTACGGADEPADVEEPTETDGPTETAEEELQPPE